MLTTNPTPPSLCVALSVALPVVLLAGLASARQGVAGLQGPGPLPPQQSRPADGPVRGREAEIVEALRRTMLRELPDMLGEEPAIGFDATGFPLPSMRLPTPAHLLTPPARERRSVPPSAPADASASTPASAPVARDTRDASEAAFLALGGLQLEVEYCGLGEGGEVLFRRTFRHELDTAARGREAMLFPDGRLFSRAGGTVAAAWGTIDRPDLRAEAGGWLDGCGFLLRMPFVSALAREPAGSFVARAPTLDGDNVLCRFARGGETIEVVRDAAGVSLEAHHRPDAGAAGRRIVFSEPMAVGAARIPALRVIYGSDGTTPAMTVRIVRARQAPRSVDSRPPAPGR